MSIARRSRSSRQASFPCWGSRGEGISWAGSLEQKPRHCSEATGVEVDGRAARLRELESSAVDEIVGRVSSDERGLIAAEAQVAAR